MIDPLPMRKFSRKYISSAIFCSLLTEAVKNTLRISVGQVSK